MKVYIVTTYYSDYEWSDKTVIGVFDSLEKAQDCKDEWMKERTLFLASPSPIPEDEMDLYYAGQIAEKREEEYMNWASRRSYEEYFNDISINTYTLNEIVCTQ